MRLVRWLGRPQFTGWQFLGYTAAVTAGLVVLL